MKAQKKLTIGSIFASTPTSKTTGCSGVMNRLIFPAIDTLRRMVWSTDITRTQCFQPCAIKIVKSKVSTTFVLDTFLCICFPSCVWCKHSQHIVAPHADTPSTTATCDHHVHSVAQNARVANGVTDHKVYFCSITPTSKQGTFPVVVHDQVAVSAV